MVDNDQHKQNGKTAGEDLVAEEAKGFDQPAAVQLPEERARRFRSPGLARMRTDWRGEDGMVVVRMHTAVETRITEHFADAYRIMFDLYSVVREPIMDDGEPRMDGDGFPVWRQTASGAFVEDWERLTSRQREKFLFQITTKLFDWSQRAAFAWGEAMFAKGIWEESFSEGYESLPGSKPTVDDRTARAKILSAEERYFALFLSYYSRRADSIVRNMELLSQRLKDVHVSNGSR
jgi:hypothetical protein